MVKLGLLMSQTNLEQASNHTEHKPRAQVVWFVYRPKLENLCPIDTEKLMWKRKVLIYSLLYVIQ